MCLLVVGVAVDLHMRLLLSMVSYKGGDNTDKVAGVW
jgi:hypothetical protein